MGIKGIKREFISRQDGIERRKNCEGNKNYIKVKGFPPTLREIGDSVELSSKGTVHRHMA